MTGRSPAVGALSASARIRARGEARAAFARVGDRTEAARAFETGGLRLRFPRSGEVCESVLINTGGGMAGGDHSTIDIVAGTGAKVLFTTQSAEKIYRSDGGTAEVETRIVLKTGAALDWLPQETILFEGARFCRRLDIDLAEDASLLLVEAVTFGRIAMGEETIDASIRDSWRIRRAGRLVFAEELRLDRAGAILDRPAVGRGARAIASIVVAAPDARGGLDRIRAALDAVCAADGERLEAGASAIDGITIARLASPSPSRLRAAIAEVMMALRGRAAPRVWT
jgi:urease accessory protein